MKIALIGTGILILDALFALVLKSFGLANEATLIAVLAIAVIGFIIQLYGAFTMKPPRFF